MERFQEKYYEYRLLRRAGDDENRLRVKADLAREIQEGRGTWYLGRLGRRIPGFDQTFGEIAEAVDDGQGVPNRYEPSFGEAVVGTLALDKDYEKVKGLILPKLGVKEAITRVGSASWARFYDVRTTPGDPSDLDTEVMISEVRPELGEDLPGCEEGLEVFRYYQEKGMADYFSYSTQIDGRPLSIHWMMSDVFESNCRLDIESLDREVLAREFRTKPKSKAAEYLQRDGNGNYHIFKAQATVYDGRRDGLGREHIYSAVPEYQPGGQITQTPTMMIGEHGQIVLGLTMDKHFAYPMVDGDVEFVESNIAVFKQSLARRLVAEGEGGTFADMPSRRDRMPYFLRERLHEEFLYLTQ